MVYVFEKVIECILSNCFNLIKRMIGALILEKNKETINP